MKFLKIRFDHVKVFKDGIFEVDLTAQDKVTKQDQVYSIYRSIHSQHVVSFVGINASGKSVAMKLLYLAMSVIGNHEKINECEIALDLIQDGTIMTTWFYIQDQFVKVQSEIGIQSLANEKKYFFVDEKIWIKKKSAVKSRASLFDFSGDGVKILRRKEIEKKFSMGIDKELNDKSVNRKVFPDDVSFAFTLTGKAYVALSQFLWLVNFNIFVPESKQSRAELNVFDGKIQRLEAYAKSGAQVQFKGEDEVHTIENSIKLEKVLSSGTLRGLSILNQTIEILQHGGYLFLDEIENHMNKEIVKLFISLFNDRRSNPRGATLLFSTHYPEILDSIERKDCIYVLRRNTQFDSEILRFSEEIPRNDLKKSIIILSNLIKGTAPSYQDIQRFKEYVWQQVDHEPS